MTTVLQHTRAALERYDAAVLSVWQFAHDFSRPGPREQQARERAERRKHDLLEAVRVDTGRTWPTLFERELRASIHADVIFNGGFATQFIDNHQHVIDGWCPSCGKGARGAYADHLLPNQTVDTL